MGKRSVDDALRAALSGDAPEAIEVLWQQYADDLLAYLAATLCSRHDTEDVLQAVFVRIVRKRHKLAKARRLDAYIYCIARNEAISYVRRRPRGRNGGTIAEPGLAASSDERRRTELVDLVENALRRLPESQRQVVVLTVYREKTFQEIGHILGVSLNTAASRYRYAMEKLRSLLVENSGHSGGPERLESRRSRCSGAGRLQTSGRIGGSRGDCYRPGGRLWQPHFVAMAIRYCHGGSSQASRHAEAAGLASSRRCTPREISPWTGIRRRSVCPARTHQTVREILSECETSGNAESNTPVGGRSRLIPVRPRLNATS